jgi:hypothetical protein
MPRKKARKHSCPFCTRKFGSPQAVGSHKRSCPNAKRFILIIDDDHEIGTRDEIEEAIKIAKEVDDVNLDDVTVYELGSKVAIDITTSIKARLVYKKPKGG